MAKKKNRTIEPESSIYDAWLWRIVTASVVAALLVVSVSGVEVFRIPKDIVFRAAGLLLLVVLTFALTSGRAVDRRIPWRAPDVLLAGGILLWSLVATAFSTNFYLSVRSFWTVVLAIPIYLAARRGSAGRPDSALQPLMWVSVANAALYLLQDFGIFNPFNFGAEYSGHSAASAFLGNANDVGSVLLFPALAALALAITSEDRKWLHWFTAALLFVTLIDSRALAAIGAYAVGATAIGVMWSWRKGVAAIVISALAVAVLLVIPPIRARALDEVTSLRAGQWNEFLRGRAPSFMAASRLFRHRPLTGTGPGTFGWQYMPQKLEIQREHPELASSAASLYNFGEVHNDHLEVLSETGLPGYALMLAALVTVASVTWRLRRGSDLPAPAAFARLFALPFALSLAVLTLAQYPLQLASATIVLLYLAAICITWSEADARS
jgi:O-antigen ligase